MGVTPGSWWINKRTGQRMAVAEPRIMFTQNTRSDRKWIQNGLGRSPGRVPCRLEGTALFLAWLTEDEIRAGWRHYRPKPMEGCVPYWIRNSKFNDYLVFHKPIKELSQDEITNGYSQHLGIQRTRSGWMCLTGMSSTLVKTVYNAWNKGKESEGHFDWGIQMYTTLFLSVAEAVPRMLPKFEKIHTTVYDHIAQGGALETD